MKKTGFWIGILIMISGANLAYANHHEDGDGSHAKKCESMAQGTSSISGLDVNKDGLITKKEYLDGDAKNTEKTFKHIDANSDGQLSLSEQQEIEAVYIKIHQKHKGKTTSI